MAAVKAVRTDSVAEEPRTDTITLRGVKYTITELDMIQYDECLKLAEGEDGSVELGAMLRQMTLRAVSPSLATRTRPLPFPVYRALERKVNTMHYTDLTDEDAAPEPVDDDDVVPEGGPPNE